MKSVELRLYTNTHTCELDNSYTVSRIAVNRDVASLVAAALAPIVIRVGNVL